MAAVTDPWAYALFTIDEARNFVGLGGSGHDEKLQVAINEASRMIEAEWGGPIISRGTQASPLIEYFEKGNRQFGGSGSYATVWSDIVVNDWPLVSVSAIYEAGTLKTASTDYRVTLLSQDPPFRVIRRLSSGLPVAWPQTYSTSTYRHIEVRYLAGYRRADDSTNTTLPILPDNISRVGRELVAWIYSQRAGKQVGLASVSDALGNRSFSGPAYITDQMRATLRAAGAQVGPRYCTGERD